MQVVARTDEYTIFKKRNERYAVRNNERQWVRGDDKVAILLAHKLIEAPVPKAPEPPEAEAAEAAAAAEDITGEAGESEAAPEAGAGDAEAEGEEKA